MANGTPHHRHQTCLGNSSQLWGVGHVQPTRATGSLGLTQHPKHELSSWDACGAVGKGVTAAGATGGSGESPACSAPQRQTQPLTAALPTPGEMLTP